MQNAKILESYSEPGELPEFMNYIAESMHAEGIRKTGVQYYCHPMKVGDKIAEIALHGKYRDSLISAAYGHDLVEDTDTDVFSPPFSALAGFPSEMEPLLVRGGRISLNGLLGPGKDESRTCYMVDRLTCRECVLYKDYVRTLFDVEDGSQEMRNLKIGAFVIKLADMWANMMPSDSVSRDYVENRDLRLWPDAIKSEQHKEQLRFSFGRIAAASSALGINPAGVDYYDVARDVIRRNESVIWEMFDIDAIYMMLNDYRNNSIESLRKDLRWIESMNPQKIFSETGGKISGRKGTFSYENYIEVRNRFEPILWRQLAPTP